METSHKTITTRTKRDRQREYLTPEEAQKLLDAVRKDNHSRNRERDYCLLLLMYRHGFRVSEACRLRVSDISLKEKRIHVNRLKGSDSTSQPMYNGEIGAVNAWLKARNETGSDSPYLFLSERRKALSRFTVCGLINKYAKAAGLEELAIHPHMLRHACGYSLVNHGVDTRLIQEYLGHRNIMHSIRYTKLSAKRFEGLWS
jgi:type 1 fimbriae regulatory protein FimB